MKIKKTVLFWAFFVCALMYFNCVSGYVRAYASPAGQPAFPQIRSVRHSAAQGVQSVTINIERFDDINVYALSDPHRIVVDISGASAPLRQHTLNVNHGVIASVRYAQFDAETARIVIDLTGGAAFEERTGKGFIRVSIATGAPDSVAVVSTPDFEGGSAQAPPPRSVDQAPAPGTQQGTQGAASPGSASVDRPPSGNGADPAPTAAPNPRDNFTLSDGEGIRAEYSGASDRHTVTIATGLSDQALQGAVFTDLTSPRGLMVTLPRRANAQGPRRVHVNTSAIKMMEISNNSSGQAQVILEFNADLSYETSVRNGAITITLRNRGIRNVSYSNSNNGRPKVTLFRTYLTEGTEDVVRRYTATPDATGRVWTIRFPSELGDIDTGSINVGDDVVESISVARSGAQTVLTINAKQRVYCSVFTTRNSRGNIWETNISLLPRFEPTERIVVIDPGHGGHDPGAPGTDYWHEKDFALDIALRVDSNLRRHGVNTFMTRNDDTFVDLFERALLASDINADLFLSIHMNAAENLEANGVETLYNPNCRNTRFSGEDFSRIVQRNVLDVTGATDRGIKERPRLVILRKTDMPAALLEVGFLSNESDLANLQRPSHRRAVARAISNAIVESFEALGK